MSSNQDIIGVLEELLSVCLESTENRTQALDNLAGELSKFRTPYRRWTGEYLHQIISGHLSASKKVIKAVDQLNTHFHAGKFPAFEKVEILAPPGAVLPNSLITKKTKTCIVCGKPFIPNSWNHVYCSKKCLNSRKDL